MIAQQQRQQQHPSHQARPASHFERCAAHCLTALPPPRPCPGFERPVSSSNQQGPARRPPKPLPDHLKPLLEECRPLYAMLQRLALKPLPTDVPRPLGLPACIEAGGGPDSGTAAAAGGGGGEGSGGLAGGGEHQREGGGLGGTGSGSGGEGKAKKGGTHAYKPDERNADILIGMRDGVTGGQRGRGGGTCVQAG